MNNLYEVIEAIFENRKRIFGGLVGFILAHTYIKYGLKALLILALFTFIGYNYSDILKKIIKVIRERMNEEY